MTNAAFIFAFQTLLPTAVQTVIFACAQLLVVLRLALNTCLPFHHGPCMGLHMQASIVALPPPDQWNDHVLSYLSGMGPDQHRGVMKDTICRLRECLWTSLECGSKHPSYQLLLDVSSHAIGRGVWFEAAEGAIEMLKYMTEFWLRKKLKYIATGCVYGWQDEVPAVPPPLLLHLLLVMSLLLLLCLLLLLRSQRGSTPL